MKATSERPAQPGLPDPLVSAVIATGATANRVQRVRRTRAGASVARAIKQAATRAEADRIAAAYPRRRLPADKRRQQRARGLPEGWHQLCVSVPADVLIALDAMIDRISAAGAGKPSRSRLIRIALARLDIEAVIDELRRTR